jgi:hypothetical protein
MCEEQHQTFTPLSPVCLSQSLCRELCFASYSTFASVPTQRLVWYPLTASATAFAAACGCLRVAIVNLGRQLAFRCVCPSSCEWCSFPRILGDFRRSSACVTKATLASHYDRGHRSLTGVRAVGRRRDGFSEITQRCTAKRSSRVQSALSRARDTQQVHQQSNRECPYSPKTSPHV